MPLITQTHRGHTIGSFTALSQEAIKGLVGLFASSARERSSALEGRTPITCGLIDGIGPVAVKTYTRGGLINRVTRHWYLRTGKPRCQKEFEILSGVGRLGIHVPEPVAFAYQGRMLYRGWLVSREIEHSQNLAQLCTTDENRCRSALAALADQIDRMISNRVIHVDLHPGNVLVDQTGRVYIVDFDRAWIDSWSPDRLRRHYVSRWKRAIEKHNLPPILDEGLLRHIA